MSLQFLHLLSRDAYPGPNNYDSNSTNQPRCGIHNSLWIITIGRKTETAISVDGHTWCQQSLLQKQKSPIYVEGQNPVYVEGPNLLTPPT